MSDAELLEELEGVMQQLGIELRLEKGEFNGGLCRIGGRPVFLLNRKLAPSSRLRILCRHLSRLDLSTVYLLPAVRDRLELEAEIPELRGCDDDTQVEKAPDSRASSGSG